MNATQDNDIYVAEVGPMYSAIFIEVHIKRYTERQEGVSI